MKTQIFITALLLFFASTMSSASNSGKKDQKTEEDIIISVFPNPVKDKAFVHFKLDNESVVEIQIFDLTGKKVENWKTSRMDQGHNKVEINTEKFKDGIYFCKLKTDKWIRTKRFLVRH